MPELPEVETVRRVMLNALGGKRIAEVELPDDPILLSKADPEPIRELLTGAQVTGVGRKGKYWWMELDRKPWLFGHLGMTGWIRELGEPTIRLREHGNAPLDDENGRPRFLKLLLTSEDGRRIAFTDGRRLGRLWLSDSPDTDKRIAKLGFDAWTEVPLAADLHKMLVKRKAPLKAVLLDQSVFAGVGNWIADEVMLQVRLAPTRLGSSLSLEDVERLRLALIDVIDHAVEVGADKEKFPEDWIFHARWGGKKGTPTYQGREIRRDTVGGRTTAWVPDLQK